MTWVGYDCSDGASRNGARLVEESVPDGEVAVTGSEVVGVEEEGMESEPAHELEASRASHGWKA